MCSVYIHVLLSLYTEGDVEGPVEEDSNNTVIIAIVVIIVCLILIVLIVGCMLWCGYRR